MNEWSKRLKEYDYNEVLEQLDIYVASRDDEPPTFGILTHPLRTFKQKEQDAAPGYYHCTRCGKKYLSMKEADDCFERDLDISYIKRISK